MRKVRIRLIPSLFPLLFVFMGFTLLVTNLHGQAQEAWVARYGGNRDDIARDIAMDDDGNVYVTGSSNGGNASYDYATLKYDRSGNQLWVARYNGPAWGTDDAYAIAVDESACVYVTGRSRGVGTGADIVTIKYDTDGNLLWLARYDGPASDADLARDVILDGEGNVHVTGYSMSSENSIDCITIKYDTNGTQIWASRYDGPGHASDEARDVALDPDGNVYVTGYVDTGVYLSCTTIGYDPDGNELWVAVYDSTPDVNSRANSIALDDEGDMYVTGRCSFAGEWYNFITIKYDNEGNKIWARDYDGTDIGFDEAWAVCVDGKGNVYVAGESEGDDSVEDYVVIKYRQNPLIHWEAVEFK